MKWNKQYKYPKSMRTSIEGKRHYEITGEHLPSVTTILSATQSAEIANMNFLNPRDDPAIGFGADCGQLLDRHVDQGFLAAHQPDQRHHDHQKRNRRERGHERESTRP